MNLFQELIEDIKIEYKTNPNKLGWRFLHTSKKTLEKNHQILLITLNPGGKIPDDHPIESCENGSAYLSESWRGKKPGTAKLQVQIQLLFRGIANNLGIEDYKEVLESSVSGHFIPFRSPNLKSLQEPKRCIEFSKNLWKKILLNQQFKLIFCIDKETYKNISEILLSMSYSKTTDQKISIGWHNYTSSITDFEKNNKRITLVWFPHLSIFSIFGREKSKEYVTKIMSEAFRHY